MIFFIRIKYFIIGMNHFDSGIEMIHPNYEILDSNKKNHLPDTLTPVYPTTQGLTQGKLRSLISQALKNRLDNIEDLLPTKIASELGLDQAQKQFLSAKDLQCCPIYF